MMEVFCPRMLRCFSLAFPQEVLLRFCESKKNAFKSSICMQAGVAGSAWEWTHWPWNAPGIFRCWFPLHCQRIHACGFSMEVSVFVVVGWCFKALCSRKGFRLLRTRCNEVHAAFEKRWNVLIPVDSHASSITITMYISKNTKIRFRLVDLYDFSSFRMHKYALHGDPNPYEGHKGHPHSTHVFLRCDWFCRGYGKGWYCKMPGHQQVPWSPKNWSLKDWELYNFDDGWIFVVQILKMAYHPPVRLGTPQLFNSEVGTMSPKEGSWLMNHNFWKHFFWKKLCTSWYGSLSHYLQGFSTVLSVEKIPGFLKHQQ